MPPKVTRRTAVFGSLAASAAVVCRPARAEAAAWPVRTIKVIVGGAAGSVPDSLARLAAQALSKRLGQAAIIENRPGAGGIVAIQSLIGSAPDGYTLAVATISQAVFNSYLYGKLSYDPRRDFLAVSTLAASASLLVANTSVQANTLSELIAQSKTAPETMLIGVPANGSPPHIAALLLLRETGLTANFIPFRSGPDALQAVLRGDIQLLVDGPTLLAPQITAGKLKAVVVTGSRRASTLPGIPTVAEAGFERASSESWMGLVAPRETPAEVVQVLSRACQAILAEPDYRDTLARISMRPTASTPEEFAALISCEHTRWSPVLRAAGLKLD